MPKVQIVSPKSRQPSGHFSQATMIEARGRLVSISGMTARRADGTIAGLGDIEAQTRQVCDEQVHRWTRFAAKLDTLAQRFVRR